MAENTSPIAQASSVFRAKLKSQNWAADHARLRNPSHRIGDLRSGLYRHLAGSH